MSKRLMVLVVFISLGLPLLSRAADIHDAVRAGNIPEIERLIKQWPNRLDSIDREKSGLTSIQLAALHGNEKVVAVLLEHMPEPASVTEGLRYAIWRGDVPMVKLFLERGAVVKSNLLDSVMNAHEVDEETLLNPDHQTKLIAVTDESRAQRLEIARLLIDKGADVNVKANLTLETPIFFASYWGREMLDLLLSKGADLRLTEAENRASPLHYAALISGDPAIFKLFLDKNLSLDLRDRLERTPLSWAARKGNLPAVQALVELGADVKAKDSAGWTALHLAASRGHKDVLEYLLAHGTDANARTNFGWTPIYAAARYGHLDEVRLLIAKGVDLNIADLDGRTPLAIARNVKAREVAKLLEGSGAKETAKICEGEACDFEREMRNRIKYFFEKPPQKNCILIQAPSGLYVFDVLPNDFSLIVDDLQLGVLREQVSYTMVAHGRARPVTTQKGKAALIIINTDQAQEVIARYAVSLATDDFEPGHLNRLRYGAGGVCDIVLQAVRERSTPLGRLRQFLPSMDELFSSPYSSAPASPPSANSSPTPNDSPGSSSGVIGEKNP